MALSPEAQAKIDAFKAKQAEAKALAAAAEPAEKKEESVAEPGQETAPPEEGAETASAPKLATPARPAAPAIGVKRKAAPPGDGSQASRILELNADLADAQASKVAADGRVADVLAKIRAVLA